MFSGMARTPTTNDVFTALSDPTRRDLIAAIGEGEATVSELVELLDMAQPQVSKHLAVLRESGLVRVRPEGKWRFYSVNGPALGPVIDWANRFIGAVNERYDRLDDLVADLSEEEAS